MAHIQKRSYRSRRTGKRTTVWQARYTAPDGRERTKRFERKADAERWLSTNSADITRGVWVDPEAGRVDLRTYANDWIESRTDLRPATQGKYRTLLDRHIFPALGPTPIASLSPSTVRRWHAELHARFPATAAGAYRLLSTICTSAVNEEVIARSPCRVKGAAAEHAPERPTASVAELMALVNATPVKYQAAVLLAGWCQLRRGEVLGLQRQDIDIEAGVLAIERTWIQSPGGQHILGPPKTEAGRRSVAIPSHILPAIKDHLRSIGPRPEDWLFPGEEGSPISTRTLSHVWSKARKAAGRTDLHFHDLRHSGLTWAAATGASLAELMRRAGHVSPAAALRYQHATDDRDRALADALAVLATSAPLSVVREPVTDEIRTKSAERDGDEATITPLTREDTEQSQRGSNPCLHLERVVS